MFKNGVFMDNKVEEIKRKIEKSATTFITGGFRPQYVLQESWIGAVNAYLPDEEIPKDEQGRLMLPLAQFYLPVLPFVPSKLKNIHIITVFVSQELPKIFEPMGKNWVIREYAQEKEIVFKELKNPDSCLKPCVLKASLVTDDTPLWDGGGLDEACEDEILELEKSGIIDDYYDIAEHYFETKIGGYPSFAQPGIGTTDGFGEGFEFVFQISSDEKANFNVVDSGSLMFAKNSQTNQWSVYYDFY